MAQRVRTNDEYAAFAKRALRAYAKRVAVSDMEDLQRMLELRDEFDAMIATAVAGVRDSGGYSWTAVGEAAGITRQSAWERWAA